MFVEIKPLGSNLALPQVIMEDSLITSQVKCLFSLSFSLILKLCFWVEKALHFDLLTYFSGERSLGPVFILKVYTSPIPVI
jgi:hypothetical protein